MRNWQTLENSLGKAFEINATGKEEVYACYGGGATAGRGEERLLFGPEGYCPVQ